MKAIVALSTSINSAPLEGRLHPPNPQNQKVEGLSWELIISTDRVHRAWDAFVAAQLDGHHEQTSLWGQVKSNFGWRVARLILYQGPTIIGGMQVLLRSAGKLGYVAYICKGPVVAHSTGHGINHLFLEFRSFARKNKVVYAFVELPTSASYTIPQLKEAGFSPYPPLLPPRIPAATTVVDLRPALEVLLDRMHKKSRYNIKLGLKKGIVVRQGGPGDLATFRELMFTLCQRRGIKPSPPQENFFAELWRAFAPIGYLKLFIAEYKGKPVSAALLFPFGQTVRAWKMGWSGEHGELCPNNVLLWKAMKWSKETGYRYFDLVGLDRKCALAVSKGVPIPEADRHGPSLFKLGFGGNVVMLPQLFGRSYFPLIPPAVGGFATRLLHFSFIHKLFEPLFKKGQRTVKQS